MDWHQLAFGKAPWWFALEVLGRSIVMNIALLAALRILGKRLSGQLTILEMGIMITLGAIVSAPMVIADRGVAFGVLLLLTVLVLLRGTASAGVHSDRVERLVHGDAVLLVADGRVLTKELDEAALSLNILFAHLRSQGLDHLGQIARVYLEASGRFSVLRATERKAGLSLYEEDERRLLGRTNAIDDDACEACGALGDREHACATCGDCRWTKAVE